MTLVGWFSGDLWFPVGGPALFARQTMTDEDTIELPNKTVDRVIKELETGMMQAETHMSHDEVRPSGHMMAMAFKDAYRELIQAHPDYEYVEGGGDD